MRGLIVVAMLVLPTGANASDIFTPRGDGRYERHTLPGTRPSERLDVRPLPGSNRATIYDSQGRRAGTIEHKSYGGAVVYDRQGRRVR